MLITLRYRTFLQQPPVLGLGAEGSGAKGAAAPLKLNSAITYAEFTRWLKYFRIGQKQSFTKLNLTTQNTEQFL